MLFCTTISLNRLSELLYFSLCCSCSPLFRQSASAFWAYYCCFVVINCITFLRYFFFFRFVLLSTAFENQMRLWIALRFICIAEVVLLLLHKVISSIYVFNMFSLTRAVQLDWEKCIFFCFGATIRFRALFSLMNVSPCISNCFSFSKITNYAGSQSIKKSTKKLLFLFFFGKVYILMMFFLDLLA